MHLRRYGPSASCSSLFATLLLAACSADDEPGQAVTEGGGCSARAALGESAEHILGGTVDEADPAVVAVNTLNVECQRAGAPSCTGTLIAPDVVLTAGHCVGELPAESFGVLFGTQADLGPGELGADLEGVFFRVAEIRLHPEFDPSSLANDVALLRLEGEATVTPALTLEEPLDPSFVGVTGRVVGFGVTEDQPAGEKRQGNVVIHEVSPLESVYSSGPSMTCSGDSGGPLFVTVDGVEYLAGVTSRGDTNCTDYGVAVQVDTLPSDGFQGAW